MIPESPMWLLILILVVVVVTASSTARHRKELERRRWEVKVCPHCGASQPAHASFCRACGQRV